MFYGAEMIYSAAMTHAPIIILVRPQMGENIGAAARVMRNFGLHEMRIVAPRDGWPNEKALDMAAHAKEMLEGIMPFETVAEAVADCHRVLAASARSRAMEKPVYAPNEAMDILCGEDKTALLFGPERTGLTTEDLALAEGLVLIDVNSECPSINLAQAVAVMSYQYGLTLPKQKKTPPIIPAPKKELAMMLGHLERILQAKHFYRVPEKETTMRHKIEAMFSRLDWTAEEVAVFRGVLTALGKDKT